MTTARTAVFRHLVRDHMAPPPVVVPAGTAAAAVVERMTASSSSGAVVVDAHHRILGILTEQDVTRRIACRPAAGGVVDEVMTRPVLTVRVDHHLYEAIGFMRRHRLRHMPVVEPTGTLVGLLDLHEALAVAAGTLTDDIDRLTHEDSFEGLAEVKAAQVQLAEHLFADQVPAPEIQALISDINNDIHRRVLRLCVATMAEDGLGEPPVPFACIVMGSGGRGESLLFPDQDNGFVLADYPDERHGAVDPWFIELAARMTACLDRLGFPYCRGGVMATSPIWRKTLPQWRHQLALWMKARVETMLLGCDIFFDFRCVYGECSLADTLRAHVTEAAARNRGFLLEMYGIQADHRAGIGLFGRLRTERTNPAHRGELNLKLQGTLPLAEGVRLMALAAGVTALGTQARIDALAAAGLIGTHDADHLRSAFAFLTGLQLRRQIDDYRAGRPVSNYVDPASLTEREVDLLKDSLRAVNDFRARLRADLTGALL